MRSLEQFVCLALQRIHFCPGYIGNSTDGTKCQGWALSDSELIYDQQWLISDTEVDGVYTLRNLRSGTYLDLSDGSSTNGTKVQGWTAASSAYVKDQQWAITADSGYYR